MAIMAQYHTSKNGTVDPRRPGPIMDHTPMPSANAPMPQNLDDIPSVRAYINEQDQKAGR